MDNQAVIEFRNIKPSKSVSKKSNEIALSLEKKFPKTKLSTKINKQEITIKNISYFEKTLYFTIQ